MGLCQFESDLRYQIFMAKAFSKITGGVLPLGLKDVFTFGKYRNIQVQHIVDTDPEYIVYLCKNSICKFTNAAYTAAETQFWRKATDVFKIKRPYSKSDDFFTHADQDDWWDDVPF